MALNGAVGGETITNSMFYSTGSSCTPAFLYNGAAGLGAYGIPSNKQRGSDYHGLSINAIAGSTQVAGTNRQVIDYFQTFGVRTNTLPSLIPAITPTVVTGPYARLQFQFTLPGDLTGGGATVEYLVNNGLAGVKQVLITTSAGWLGGSAVNLTTPDFTGVLGWQDGYAAGIGSGGTWFAVGGGGTGGPCAGGKLFSSSRNGTFGTG
jgi:hypothetical protein